MTRWEQVLREWEPEPLDVEQAAAIRRAAVEAATEYEGRGPDRRAPAVIIGCLLTTAAMAGIFVARSQPPRRPDAPHVASPGALRQLQFATPGGTRIIWQFDPEFRLRETLP